MKNFEKFERFILTGFFIDGAIFVIVPLYLFSLNMELEEIGAILALSPFLFAITRLIVAILSDIEGISPFLPIYSITRGLQSLAYIASSPPFFALGRMLDGIGRGTVWAVLRTAGLKFGKAKKRVKEVIGLGHVGLSLGNVVGLIAVSFLGFIQSFIGLFLLSLINLYYGLSIKEHLNKFNIKKLKEALKEILKIREEEFYKASIVVGTGFGLIFLLLNFLFSYTYTQELKLSYVEFSIIMGLIQGMAGLVLLINKKFNISVLNLFFSFLSFLSFVIGLFLISLKIKILYFISSIFFGFSIGSLLKFTEEIILKEIGKTKNSGLEVAMLVLPSALIEGILTFFSSVIIENFGIFNLLWGLGIILLLYKSIGHKIIED